MHGEVRIYKNPNTENEELIYEENNLLVDGASELIVDILTANPAQDVHTHLLDASNYTIQAISFGKPQSAYSGNAHSLDMSALVVYGNPWGGGDPAREISGIRVLSSTWYGGPSAYPPTNSYMPPPSPMDTKLCESSETPIDVATQASGGYIGYIDNSHGNLPNTGPLLPYQTTLRRNALLKGCFPAASGVIVSGTNVWIVSSVHTALTDIKANYVWSGQYESLFNTVESMDLSGFINMPARCDNWISHKSWGGIHNPANDEPRTLDTKGLVVSAEADFYKTGKVDYNLYVSGSDLGYANLFGGIYNMGLWSLDRQTMLEVARYEDNPTDVATGIHYPYSFYNNIIGSYLRRYKLFAIKSFTKNLCHITDDGDTPGAMSYQDLKIVWSIIF